MLFDNYECASAEGIILAHTIRTPYRVFRKGLRLSHGDLMHLRENGISRIPGVRPEEGDVGENQAALEVARALAGAGLDIGKPVAGRCYLYSRSRGLAQIDREAIDEVNLIDSGIVVATLAEDATCLQGQAVASIKVIPFVIARQKLRCVLEHIDGEGSAIVVREFQPMAVALVQTCSEWLKESSLDTTSRVTLERVAALGGRVVDEFRCDHTLKGVEAALTEVLKHKVDLILMCGATVTVDEQDILPAAIVRCGGVVDHLGLPVEPGNMLVLAHIGESRVVILPGCGRSSKLNGLDWVLQKIAAGMAPSKSDILRMGVGGLIKDINHRQRIHQRGTK